MGVENFDEIPLSHTVKEMEANLCFFHFRRKFENSKWPPFLGKGIFFFENWWSIFFGYLRVENSNKITISHGYGHRSKLLFFAFLAKIRKFKMAAIFGERKIF